MVGLGEKKKGISSPADIEEDIEMIPGSCTQHINTQLKNKCKHLSVHHIIHELSVKV